MSLDTIPFQAWQNVVANGVAVTDLSHVFGQGIERMTLKLGGTFTKSMITSLQLKANSKVIVDTTGSRLDSRMLWRGFSANAAYLTLDFTELRAKTRAAMLSGVLDTTVGIRSLRLEATIAGATAPTLAGSIEVCKPLVGEEFKGVRPLVARVHTVTQVIGAAGTFPLQIPHMDPNTGGSLFKRIAIFSSNCTGFRVERNGQREMEWAAVADLNFNAGEYGRVSQAGMVVADFIRDGLFEDRILDTRPQSGTTTANLFATFSAGETITIEVEVLEPIDVY